MEQGIKDGLVEYAGYEGKDTALRRAMRWRDCLDEMTELASALGSRSEQSIILQLTVEVEKAIKELR
jgi:hypothetical protein